MIGINLKDFQERTVDFLIDKTMDSESNRRIIVKSPTGSGKTIILLNFIERYLDISDAVFCWLCPGKGELEKQSLEKMNKFCPNLKTGDIDSIINNGFELNTTYFINWEKITKRGNIAISDTERKNLFERIAEAHSQQFPFIIIIDEEHNNDTKKADDIINSINAKYEIRVSATPNPKSIGEMYEIKEEDVINEGLITKFMYINKDLNEVEIDDIQHETNILIEKANEIRKQIKEKYRKIGENINPLVLVQFPNLNDDLIQQVEDKLNEMGYSYENGLVSSWFSSTDKKEKSKKIGIINLKDITNIDGKQDFLLFKQAIATGWDCPRAKILVKLREKMSETFEIQTLGRLRRMPRAIHYEDDILDCSYLYTFDEKYKLEVINSGLGCEKQKVFLKNDAKEIKLIKQTRKDDYQYQDEKKVRKNIYEFLKKKYKLGTVKENNKKILEIYGYEFGEYITKTYLKGKYTTFEQITKSKDISKMNIKIDTHLHGIDLQHNTNELKKTMGLSYETTNKILRTLFKKGYGINSNKLLNLKLSEYYTFIINNIDKLKEVFYEFQEIELQDSGVQQIKEAKEDYFYIPKEEYYDFIPNSKNVEIMNSNVYKGYNTSMIVEGIRSKPERLFEKYCESSENVKYFYKNGDKGTEYLSIVYITNLGKESLFYPDYVVEMKDGTIWLIETKGGEYKGQSKNIDIQVGNKFKVLKNFCKRHGYNFGFVRDANDELYINNENYVDDMKSDSWKKLSKVI
ncbi:DEAD/DEAH box helicase [Sneathia sanguinegens]|uniref:DEAD/DEAH box helicase n=1 Tax=Sneathia sanguinegens TaxID=40543 RepID=UPI0023F97536|nr:DEAD/DEAH box helicase family protein [Sneathia sanguinegens]